MGASAAKEGCDGQAQGGRIAWNKDNRGKPEVQAMCLRLQGGIGDGEFL